MKKILILCLFLFNCTDPNRGWTDSGITKIKKRCERIVDDNETNGRKFKKSWEFLSGDKNHCNCIVDAIVESISFKDFKNLESVGHEINQVNDISPAVISASMISYNTINSKEAKMIRYKLKDCCSCESKLCNVIFIITEFIINPEELFESEVILPEWCE